MRTGALGRQDAGGLLVAEVRRRRYHAGHVQHHELRHRSVHLDAEAEGEPAFIGSAGDPALEEKGTEALALPHGGDAFADGVGDADVFAMAARDGGAAAAFEHLLALESASWKGADGTAIASDPATLRFYRGIALEGPIRRWARLDLLRVDDRVVAAQLDLAGAGAAHDAGQPRMRPLGGEPV